MTDRPGYGRGRGKILQNVTDSRTAELPVPSVGRGRGRGAILERLLGLRLNTAHLRTHEWSEAIASDNPYTNQHDESAESATIAPSTAQLMKEHQVPPTVTKPEQSTSHSLTKTAELTVHSTGTGSGRGRILKALQDMALKRAHLRTHEWSEAIASDNPYTNQHDESAESASIAPLTAQLTKELVYWTSRLDVINFSEAEQKFSDKPYDLESYLYHITEGQRMLLAYSIAIAQVFNVLPVNLQLANQITDKFLVIDLPKMTKGETIICKAYRVWLGTLKCQIFLQSGHVEKAQILWRKISKEQRTKWADLYVLASYYLLGNVMACRHGLSLLKTVSLADISNSTVNEGFEELIFMKAKILGKLRYYEQWTSNRWEEECTLMNFLISSNPNDCRYLLYTANVMRRRVYRKYLEGGQNPRLSMTSVGFKMHNDIIRAFYLLKNAVPILENDADGLSCICLEMLKFPDHEDMGIDEHVVRLSRQSMTLNKESVMVHLAASSMFELWGEYEQAENHLIYADGRGSTFAKLQLIGFRYRYFQCRPIPDELLKLPEGPQQWVSYLAICLKKYKEAKIFVREHVNTLSPSVMAHQPIWVKLDEPISLLNFLLAKGNGFGQAGGFLCDRNQIFREANRLMKNIMFRDPTNFKRKPKKKKVPMKVPAVMEGDSVDSDYENPNRRRSFFL